LAADPDTNRPQALGHTIAEISEKASLLVREEIELAKTEISQKATRLGKGAAVAAAAGVFAFFGLIFFLEFLAWFLIAIFNFSDVFWGFLIVTLLLFGTAGLCALIGIRWIKKGAPPTPTMAIEEARKIQETVKG
jgi:cobalamin biosynthesis protein CobD/CbiB